MNRPNIIFYFTDQQRWDTIGCYGQKLNITPNLDKLAKEGTIFEYAFTPQPVCGPARAAFQTGKYPTELGCYRNGIALPQNVKTIADYLTENGYETGYVGKWHLASTEGLENEPDIDYRTKAIPLERRGGYKGFWRAADVLEFTSHGYDGYVFDEYMRNGVTPTNYLVYYFFVLHSIQRQYSGQCSIKRNAGRGCCSYFRCGHQHGWKDRKGKRNASCFNDGVCLHCYIFFKNQCDIYYFDLWFDRWNQNRA